MEDKSGMNRTKKKTLESIHCWEAARGLAAWGGSSQILIETRIRRKNLGCSYRRLSPHRTQHNFYYSRRATNSNGWRDLEAILSAFLAQIDKHHLNTQNQPCLCQRGLSFFLFFFGCSEPPPLPMLQSPTRTLFLDSNRAYHDQAFFYWSTGVLFSDPLATSMQRATYVPPPKNNQLSMTWSFDSNAHLISIRYSNFNRDKITPTAKHGSRKLVPWSTAIRLDY